MKRISINYHFVQWCNLACSYCSDPENRDHVAFSTTKQLDEFIRFIKNIHDLSTEIHIEICLIGWEPLIDKNIAYLIGELFNIRRRVSIIIATNGLLIGRYLDVFRKYPTLRLHISYHWKERLRHGGPKPFLKDVESIKEIGMDLKISILVPNEREYFSELKQLSKDLVTFPYAVSKNKIIIQPIKGPTGESIEYPQDIESYIESFVDPTMPPDKRTTIEDQYRLWTAEYTWFKCYPFQFDTHIIVNIDLSVRFGACHTLEGKYSLAETFQILSWVHRLSWRFVTCRDKLCSCVSAWQISKAPGETATMHSSYLFRKIHPVFWDILEEVLLSKNSANLNIIELRFRTELCQVVAQIEWHNDKLRLSFYPNGPKPQIDKLLPVLQKTIIKASALFQYILYQPSWIDPQ